MLAEPPPAPFDWVREGTSVWLFADDGSFAIPRVGVEAEPHSWHDRRYAANLALADGRVLQTAGLGPMPPVLDDEGRPAVLGGGPVTFRCIEPFRRWLVGFEGETIDTTSAAQLSRSVDQARRAMVRYQFELAMAAPPNVQEITPQFFFGLPKGKQRDAVSIGLGLRFDQLLTGSGWYEIDGEGRSVTVTGNRIKRRSVRTDGLMLRGHAWQAALFPDGSGFGYEARPVHDDGFEPWNHAYVYKDGVMHEGHVENVSWLPSSPVAQGEDVSLDIHTDLGVTRVSGRTGLTTSRVASNELWGLNLQQGGAYYEMDGQEGWGMIERSMPTGGAGKG